MLIFGALMPLILPLYLIWLSTKIEIGIILVILGAVMIALAIIDVIILLLVRTPLRLMVYVPLFIALQTLVMRPFRVIALVAELVFSVTRYDPYIPKSQRGSLS